jgi:hypothetical protein
VNASLGADTTIVTVRDNDPLPSLSVNDLVVTEGEGGTQVATFFVTLSAPSGRPVSFSARTADGTALADQDYRLASLLNETIPAGLTAALFPVTVTAAPGPEPDESFAVQLFDPVNATLADAEGVCAIKTVRIESIGREGNDIVLAFPTASAGKRYHIDRAEELRSDGTGWQQISPIVGGLPGTGGLVTFRDVGAGSAPHNWFYRLREEVQPPF